MPTQPRLINRLGTLVLPSIFAVLLSAGCASARNDILPPCVDVEYCKHQQRRLLGASGLMIAGNAAAVGGTMYSLSKPWDIKNPKRKALSLTLGLSLLTTGVLMDLWSIRIFTHEPYPELDWNNWRGFDVTIPEGRQKRMPRHWVRLREWMKPIPLITKRTKIRRRRMKNREN